RARENREENRRKSPMGQADGQNAARHRSDALNRKVDTADHDDERDARGHQKQGHGVGDNCDQVGAQKERVVVETNREHRRRQHEERSVILKKSSRGRHGHTICSTSSIWAGLAPGGASKVAAILPSRMTRMRFDRLMTSSSVSPSRMIAMPS